MKIFACVISVALTCAGSSFAGTLDRFSGVVGFGDSLVDKGRLEGFLAPPSLGGRFSDGPTWLEQLGAAFEARGLNAVNMALGGATAGDTNLNDPRYALADAISAPRDPSNPDDIPALELRNFSAQITSFFDRGFDTVVGANPLVVLSFGGNDLLQGVTAPTDIIAAINAGITALVTADPTKYTNFLLANLPNLAIGPANSGLSDADKLQLTNETLGFNFLLEQGAALTAQSLGVHLEIFDVFTNLNIIQTEARLAGLIVDEACTESLTDLETALDISQNACLLGGSENFLFMDDVHPGKFAHDRLGAAAIAQVADRLPAPVPLPAGLPLLLAALGALAITRSKRAGA